MERLHPIFNRDYQKLHNIINYIAYIIGGKLETNPIFDERGLTDDLLDLLKDYFGYIKSSKYAIKLDVKKPTEAKTGADIIFRIIVNTQDVSFDRYVLAQAKKYIASDDKFSETNNGNKHLTGQVKKMHDYNPEFSYVLLYSNMQQPLANKVTQSSNPYPFFHYRYIPAFAINETLPVVSNLHGNYPITLLRSKTWEKMKNNQPANLLSYSETLPDFLLNDLVTGKIGKDWDDIIERAQGNFSIIVILIGQQ